MSWLAACSSGHLSRSDDSFQMEDPRATAGEGTEHTVLPLEAGSQELSAIFWESSDSGPRPISQLAMKLSLKSCGQCPSVSTSTKSENVHSLSSRLQTSKAHPPHSQPSLPSP